METFNCEAPRIHFPPSKSQRETQHLWTSIQQENHCYLSCISILIVRNIRRKQLFLFFSRFSNYFQQNYLLYLFDQGRHRKKSRCTEVFVRRIVNLCSLHLCLDSPKFPRGASFFLFRSIFKLVFLSHYKFAFLHHELSLKNNTCRGVLR